MPNEHQSLSYVFTERANNSGYGDGTTAFTSPWFWLVFGLGFLMAQYTITGFDASAHTAEETHQASRTAAVGMYMSVVVSVAFGWVLLLAVTFAIPGGAGAATDATAAAMEQINNFIPVVPWIWETSMSRQWAEALLFICVVAQFFCVTASTTSASRMMFAFSRDRAVPGHQLWRRVSRHRVPVYSVFGVVFFAAILMAPTLQNYWVGYFVGTAIAVIGLYIAFIIPMYLRWRLGDSWDEPRAWSLGNHYKWITPISIVWVAIITVLFSLPFYKVGIPGQDDFTWEFTNYTVVWFAAIGLVFGGWWALSAKNWFKGPVRMGSEDELEGSRRSNSGSSSFRPRRKAHRQRSPRGAPHGAPRSFQASSATRNAGSAAVRSMRSKCSAAYPTKSKSSSDTADCTTPHIASRKSDMKRMSSSARASSSRTSPK